MGLTCLLPFSSLNTLPLHFFPSLFPFSPSLRFTLNSLCFSSDSFQMFFPEEAVHFQLPVLSSNEIEELLALLQSDHDPVSVNSGSEGSSRTVHVLDERKRRRMISNRESARRSRWRKKQHEEILTAQVNRLTVENRALKHRLGSVLNQWMLTWGENERLKSEVVGLRARLSDLHRVFLVMQSRN